MPTKLLMLSVWCVLSLASGAFAQTSNAPQAPRTAPPPKTAPAPRAAPAPSAPASTTPAPAAAPAEPPEAPQPSPAPATAAPPEHRAAQVAPPPPPSELRPPPPPAQQPRPQRPAYAPYGTAQNSTLTYEERRALLQEISSTERSIEALKVQRDQHPITGPVVMVAAGYGGALVLGLAATISWATGEEIDRGLREGDPDFDDATPADADHARVAARILGGLTVMPLALGIVGSVFLKQRLEQRRKFNPELSELMQRRKELQRELHYGVRLSQGGAGLSVVGRF